MKRTGKRITVALMVLSLMTVTALPALARPDTKSGEIAGTSELRYRDLAVSLDGSISFTLENTSDREALFNGRVLFRNDDSVLAGSALMTNIPVNAGGSTRITVEMERGSWLDYNHASAVEWSGVRVAGGDRVPSDVQRPFGWMLD